MLQMPASVYRQLRRHGEAAYPHECCGVLVGTVAGSAKSVAQAIPVENASASDTRSHYEIAPLALIRIEKTARTAGMQIVGFYHSHPDHPAHWSATDLAQAHWIGCSYLITEIRAGTAGATHSFHLAGSTEEDKHLEAEEMHLAETGASRPNSGGHA